MPAPPRTYGWFDPSRRSLPIVSSWATRPEPEPEPVRSGADRQTRTCGKFPDTSRRGCLIRRGALATYLWTVTTPDGFTPTPRRSRLVRCSALAWAVVFLLSGLRPAFAAVECPHHLAAGHTADIAYTGQDGERGGRHGHAAHEAGSSSTDPDHDFCTCVGPCHVTGAAPMPAVAWATLPDGSVTAAATATRFHIGVLPGRASYSLPFATAPPRSC